MLQSAINLILAHGKPMIEIIDNLFQMNSREKHKGMAPCIESVATLYTCLIDLMHSVNYIERKLV